MSIFMCGRAQSHCLFFSLTPKQGVGEVCRRKPPQPNNHSQCVFVNINLSGINLHKADFFRIFAF